MKKPQTIEVAYSKQPIARIQIHWRRKSEIRQFDAIYSRPILRPMCPNAHFQSVPVIWPSAIVESKFKRIQ